MAQSNAAIVQQQPLLSDFIGLYKSVLTEEECKEIIQFFEDCHTAGLTNVGATVSGQSNPQVKDSIDFFKIDVQGYESEIIKHGKDKIKNSLIINIETSPTPLYKNEKTFSSTIIELEKLGFNLHMFSKINTRSFKPIIFFKNPYIGLNHIHQLDCVLIKNLKFINTYNTSQLSKLILILFYSFKSYDLVDYLLKILDQKNNTKFVEKFRSILSKIKIVKKY